jgi:hypothetical protein
MKKGGVMKRIRISMFSALIIVFLPAVCIASVLGPYSGTVIDSQTGEAIEGASVLFSREAHVPVPPDGLTVEVAVRMVRTDKSGKYKIPLVFAPKGLLSVYNSTRCIIYQPGYQAYFAFLDSDSAPATFKKRGNIVKLDRIPPNFNYKEHYRRIEDALNLYAIGWEGLTWGRRLTWKKHMKSNLRREILGKEELLRRAEWEGKRGEHR